MAQHQSVAGWGTGIYLFCSAPAQFRLDTKPYQVGRQLLFFVFISFFFFSSLQLLEFHEFSLETFCLRAEQFYDSAGGWDECNYKQTTRRQQ